jgi:CBS domain-containing protein
METAMTVSDILRYKGDVVVTIEANARTQDAADLLRRKNIGAVLVKDGDGKTVGLLTERDIVQRLADMGDRLAASPVTAAMSKEWRTCRADASVRTVMETMTRYRVRHLPVVDEFDRTIGIISIGDVIKQRLRDLETETNVLRDIIVAGQ